MSNEVVRAVQRGGVLEFIGGADGNTLLFRATDTVPTYEIWVSPAGNDTTGLGSFASPYLTLATAFAAVTATRKKVILMPGTYTSAASLAWPVGVTDMLVTGITSDAESTIINASAGDEVVEIVPNATIGASNVLCFFADLTISADDGINGVQVTNTNMTASKKIIVTFREVVFLSSDDTTEYSLITTHTDTDSLIKIYMHGRGMGGCNVEAPMYLDMQNAGDRFKANGMNFEGGIEFNTTGAVASEHEFNNCIMKLGGGSGGNASNIVNANGCVSRSGAATQAAAAKGDFCTNGTYTDMSFA